MRGVQVVKIEGTATDHELLGTLQQLGKHAEVVTHMRGAISQPRVKEGYLRKQPVTGVALRIFTLRRRYIVLTPAAIQWYSSAAAAVPNGELSLLPQTAVVLSDGEVGAPVVAALSVTSSVTLFS